MNFAVNFVVEFVVNFAVDFVEISTFFSVEFFDRPNGGRAEKVFHLGASDSWRFLPTNGIRS